MTSLQTLDLSYNELNDLSEPDVFQPPNNLTNLIMHHNRFNHLPWNKILSMQNLKHLDLEYNDFSNIDANLMKVLHNGTRVTYAGNVVFKE